MRGQATPLLHTDGALSHGLYSVGDQAPSCCCLINEVVLSYGAQSLSFKVLEQSGLGSSVSHVSLYWLHSF